MERCSLRRRREKEVVVIREVIWPAIEGHNCPICLRDLEPRYSEAAVLARCNHAYCTGCIQRWSKVRRTCPLCNSEFNSWFCNLSLSSRSFRKHFLTSSSSESQSPGFSDDANLTRFRSSRFIGRRRVAVSNRQSRALPWRRSFGRPGLVSLDIIAQRKLQWRASIYNQRLKPDSTTLRCLELGCKGCGPCNLFVFMGTNLLRNISRKDAVKKEILQRIEPWVMRELKAILGDPDPTVIVHVVTSQFMAWLEEKARSPSGQLDVGESFIAPLRPFLNDKASIFWHELSCFAGSCHSLDTYDEVVDYKREE